LSLDETEEGTTNSSQRRNSTTKKWDNKHFTKEKLNSNKWDNRNFTKETTKPLEAKPPQQG